MSRHDERYREAARRVLTAPLPAHRVTVSPTAVVSPLPGRGAYVEATIWVDAADVAALDAAGGDPS